MGKYFLDIENTRIYNPTWFHNFIEFSRGQYNYIFGEKRSLRFVHVIAILFFI
jgi:hypothetical protein